jgi:hypothetical protein
MLQISRKLHCALAGIEVEAFKTLQQYGRLPVLPAAFRPDKPFGPLETLVLAVYNTMAEHHHVARAYAANICSAGAEVLSERWDELRQTAAQRHDAKEDELLFGRVTFSAAVPLPDARKPVVGTLEEIAAEVAAERRRRQERNQQYPTTSTITVSITRVANQVSHRAAKHGIDIEQFWTEPFRGWRPQPRKTRPRKKGAAR